MASILLIDDDGEIRSLVTKILKFSGHSVIAFEDGENALLGLKGSKLPALDLILLDISLPGLPGYEVAKQIKENIAFQHVPIVFFSARSPRELDLKAKEIGARGFISKPFSVRELECALQKFVRKPE